MADEVDDILHRITDRDAIARAAAAGDPAVVGSGRPWPVGAGDALADLKAAAEKLDRLDEQDRIPPDVLADLRLSAHPDRAPGRGRWLPCTPALIETGQVDCATTPRRPGFTHDHDHWIPSPRTPAEAEAARRFGEVFDRLKTLATPAVAFDPTLAALIEHEQHRPTDREEIDMRQDHRRPTGDGVPPYADFFDDDAPGQEPVVAEPTGMTGGEVLALVVLLSVCALVIMVVAR